MKLALIQCNPITGALSSNADNLISWVAGAMEHGPDLCVAPELALCGHNACDLLLRTGFADECRERLESMAERLAVLGAPPFLLGAPVANPVPQGKSLQNCAVMLHESKVRVVSRKVLLPNEGNLDDTRYFEPGVACGVLHLKGWRLAVTIGEDVWNDRTFWKGKRNFNVDPVAEFISAGGADGLINITALPYEQGLPELHERMLSRLAAHYRVPVASVNLMGGNDSLVYYGGSPGFDAGGRLLVRGPFFSEGLVIMDMCGREPSNIAPLLPQTEELWRAVVTGLRDFVRKCGFTKVVVGLSGGVDSSLVAALAAEALGAANVTGLIMPSVYTTEQSIKDAQELAANLEIQTHILPIADMLASFDTTFGAVFDGGLRGVTEENAQARIRCLLLMAFSNHNGAMVLGTGNKSEAAVGYATLYGDQLGGLEPIADLYKHQVYSLCRWYNGQRPKGIPESVLAKAPSAELRPGQKDSDTLPPYEELDPMLFCIIENRENVAELVERGYDEHKVREVFNLVRKAEFKRYQAPPALHLSTCGFGSSWRLPIAAMWQEA